MLRKGFADLQVNGFLGVDFSSPSLTADDVHRVTEALVKAGTVAFCATIITSELEIYRRNLPVLARAMEQPALKHHLLGIHLEGPYLSAADGARGAHAPEKMRRPDAEEFQRLQEWADGKIAILTIAPELDGSLDLISFVRRNGPVRIAVGHHLASREILQSGRDRRRDPDHASGKRLPQPPVPPRKYSHSSTGKRRADSRIDHRWQSYS